MIDCINQSLITFRAFFLPLLTQGQNDIPDVHYLAVSEHGVKLVKRDKITDELEILREIP